MAEKKQKNSPTALGSNSFTTSPMSTGVPAGTIVYDAPLSITLPDDFIPPVSVKTKKPKKLVKLEYTYEDGSKQTLKGPQAQEWLEWVNGALMMAAIHGSNGKTFDWEHKKAKKKVKK